MPILETAQRRFFAPESVFGGTWRHNCLRPGCPNVMVVPCPATPGAPATLQEGQMWQCATCFAIHEYYMVLNPGSRQACVRLLVGPHIRENGEPSILEFIDMAVR